MIIKNEMEAKRIQSAVNGDIGCCHKNLTVFDRNCSNSNNLILGINNLCSRLFPKIIISHSCPCDTYNIPYIKRKCRKELALWHNRR